VKLDFALCAHGRLDVGANSFDLLFIPTMVSGGLVGRNDGDVDVIDGRLDDLELLYPRLTVEKVGKEFAVDSFSLSVHEDV
jgi:hypothetical protein